SRPDLRLTACLYTHLRLRNYLSWGRRLLSTVRGRAIRDCRVLGVKAGGFHQIWTRCEKEFQLSYVVSYRLLFLIIAVTCLDGAQECEHAFLLLLVAVW